LRLNKERSRTAQGAVSKAVQEDTVALLCITAVLTVEVTTMGMDALRDRYRLISKEAEDREDMEGDITMVEEGAVGMAEVDIRVMVRIVCRGRCWCRDMVDVVVAVVDGFCN
jgi:hypothetical protein